MLAVLSKNKSYASISIEKGILEAHGIRSWIWDSDGCSWYGEQGAIRCRLVVSSDKIEEAVAILNSDFLALENSEQPKELHATPSADLSPPLLWAGDALWVTCMVIFGIYGRHTSS